MTTNREYEIICPIFPGFYNTIYDLSESWEDGEREHLENEYEVTDINCINWDIKEYENDVSKDFVNILEQHGKDIGILSNFDFIKVDSPKYYNYRNDYIIAKLVLTDSNIQAINKYLLDNQEALSKYLQNCQDGIVCITDFSINWVNSDDMVYQVLDFILRHYLDNNSNGDWEIELYYDSVEGIYPSVESVCTDYGTFTISEIVEGKHKEFIKEGA